MPPFLQLSDQDVADLIDYVRSAWGNHGRPITAAEVTAARARGQ
jgi:cytochrome c oxidase cbb3-type subunit 2